MNGGKRKVPGSNNRPSAGREDRRTARNDTIEAMLHEGERVVNRGIVSPGIYWKGAFVAGLGFLLLLTPIFNLGVFLMLVALIMFVMAHMTRHYLLLVLTNRRVIMRYGVIQLDTIQIRLNRIESVELERTIPGQFLNYATVVLTGTGNRLAAVPFIENAFQFRSDLDKLLFAIEKNQRAVPESIPQE